jgi:hypothetical protein
MKRLLTYLRCVYLHRRLGPFAWLRFELKTLDNDVQEFKNGIRVEEWLRLHPLSESEVEANRKGFLEFLATLEKNCAS